VPLSRRFPIRVSRKGGASARGNRHRLRGERAADMIGAAVMVAKIATGQIEDRPPTPEEQGKDPAAVALGRKGGLKGGKARAASMTSRQRRAAAKKAAAARWRGQ
jgi:hypothetical protein